MSDPVTPGADGAPATPIVSTRRKPDVPAGWQPGAVESRAVSRSMVPTTYDAASRSVEGVFATPYRVRRWFGWEELRIAEEAINLQRVNLGQCRLLDHHNAYERGSILGVVTEARVENGALVGRITFGENDVGRAVEADVAAGLLTGISVGYRINRLVLAEMGDDGEDDVYRADSWELLEVSLVSVPADPNSAVRSLVDRRAPLSERDEPARTGLAARARMLRKRLAGAQRAVFGR